METKPRFSRKSGSMKQPQATNKNLSHRTTKFSCNFCDYTTNHKSNLTSHIRIHTGEKPFKCQHPNCEAAFAFGGNLKQHQLVYNKDDESLLKFKCPTCPFKCGLNSVLKSHMKIHSDVKEFACDLCPFRTKQKHHIARHHKNVHSTEKLFNCPQPGCQHSFKTKENLNRHIKVHSNEQPFVCSFGSCGFQTKWKESLTNHEMAHRKDMPFKCSFCTLSFTLKSSLVRHFRSHTGETPFPCQKCSYRAKSSCKLTRHVKRVHGNHKANKIPRQAIPMNRAIALNCKVVSCNFSTREESALASHFDTDHGLPRVVLKKI